MRDIALHRGGASFAAWGKLEHAVRSGEPAFEAAQGEPFFTYLRRNHDAGAAFDGAMTRLSQDVVAEAVRHYDFAAAERVLDVGGGRGHFLAAVLDAHPRLDGAVFEVLEPATAAVAHLGDRGGVVVGDFFESLPAGYEQLLAGAGFTLHDVVTRPSGFSILDCRPVHG